MEITEQHRREMEQIAKEVECPRKLACCRSEPENIPPVNASRFGNVLECSWEGKESCSLTFDFGFGLCCTCPLRHYVAKHFGK